MYAREKPPLKVTPPDPNNPQFDMDFDESTSKPVKVLKETSSTEKSKITTMRCGNIEKPIGPYSFGKIINKPGIGKWAFSSGQVGTNADGVLTSKKASS